MEVDKRPFRFRHVHKISVVFVLTAVVFVIGAIVFAGYVQGWFEPKTSYRVELPMDGTAGLDKGADVMVLGKKVGVIENIELLRRDGVTKVRRGDQISPDSIKQVAMVSVRGEYTRFIGEDSEAKLKNGLGGFGAAYIEITRGAIPRKERGEKDGGSLPFVVEKGVQDDVNAVLVMVTEKVGPLLDSLTETSDSVNELVTSFTSDAGAFQQTLASLEETMEKVNSGDGAVPMLLNDDGFRDDLTNTLSSVDETMVGLKSTVGEIEGFIEQFNNDTMPKLNKTMAEIPPLVATTKDKLAELDIEQVNSLIKEIETSVPPAVDEASQLLIGLQRFPLISPFVPSDDYMLEWSKRQKVMEKAKEEKAKELGGEKREAETVKEGADKAVRRGTNRWRKR